MSKNEIFSFLEEAFEAQYLICPSHPYVIVVVEACVEMESSLA